MQPLFPLYSSSMSLLVNLLRRARARPSHEGCLDGETESDGRLHIYRRNTREGGEEGGSKQVVGMLSRNESVLSEFGRLPAAVTFSGKNRRCLSYLSPLGFFVITRVGSIKTTFCIPMHNRLFSFIWIAAIY